MWEQTLGEWVEMGYRSGVATQYGTNHDFSPSATTYKTYRLRIYVYTSGYTHTTASFQHKA